MAAIETCFYGLLLVNQKQSQYKTSYPLENSAVQACMRFLVFTFFGSKPSPVVSNVFGKKTRK